MKKSEIYKMLKSGEMADLIKESVCGKPAVNNSQELYNILKPLTVKDDDREHFMCVFVNAKNKILKIETLFTGSIGESPVYPREVVKRALKLKALAVIFSHNHPSGDPEPSKNDLMITKQLLGACATMGITVHEHIIIGNGKYFSMTDQGIIANYYRQWRDFSNL